MDHRCLYGHRVPAAFTFAIQNRACPTCGSPTVTLTGYQAARTLAADAGLDAMAAFQAIRVLEGQWTLSPREAPAAPAATPGPALGAPEPARGAAGTEEEVVVVEEVGDAAATGPAGPPEPRITPRIRQERPAVPRAPAPPAAAGGRPAPGFGKTEDEFFKGQ
jgi:hypothetical protein